MEKYKSFIEEYNHTSYKEELYSIWNRANKELTDTKPWDKSVGMIEKINIIISQLVYLDNIMILLYPIIPNKITELRGYLGWNNSIELNITIDKVKAFNIIN